METDDREEELYEHSPPHGDIVVLIARGVGFLVLIVSIFILITILMLIKTIISFFVDLWGVSIILLLTFGISWSVLKLNKVSFSVLWGVLTKSCG